MLKQQNTNYPLSILSYKTMTFMFIPFTHSSLVLNLNEVFFLLNINVILKNVENQTVAGPP